MRNYKLVEATEFYKYWMAKKPTPQRTVNLKYWSKCIAKLIEQNKVSAVPYDDFFCSIKRPEHIKEAESWLSKKTWVKSPPGRGGNITGFAGNF